MGFSAAVLWWRSVQVYVAVGGSAAAQVLLSVLGFARKFHIPPWVRLCIWLAFLSSDALVIYALAALLNRPTLQQDFPAHDIGRHDLQVFWAPILLIYLSGQPMMTAYNMEDNELWGRTLLTTPFQIGAALFVFYTSWPRTSADKKLSAAALCLFFIGGLRYVLKVLSLRSASFDTMSNSSNKANMSPDKDREEDIGEYIKCANEIVMNSRAETVSQKYRDDHLLKLSEVVDRLFVDVYVYPYSDRLDRLKCFWELKDEEAYNTLKYGLSDIFDILYTRNALTIRKTLFTRQVKRFFLLYFTWILGTTLLILAFIWFRKSQRRGYNHLDVVLTFLLLTIIFAQDVITYLSSFQFDIWPETVAQHSIIGDLALNKRGTSTIWTCTAGYRMEFLYKYCFMDYCRSSKEIIGLVREHIQAGWNRYICDAESYREFNDTRGQFTLLQLQGCRDYEYFRRSLEKPFDESIVLWHLATDFCYHHHQSISSGFVEDDCRLRGREISKYMMHLLVASPEMLMAGSRRNLFTTAYEEVERLLKHEASQHEALLTKELIAKMRHGKTVSEPIVGDAWLLAERLMRVDGGEKRWKVIQGVWVEMLCFSAGRCRGFLHAKALGYGGEYLSYVWLLLAHAGMETFSDRLQRTQRLVHSSP